MSDQPVQAENCRMTSSLQPVAPAPDVSPKTTSRKHDGSARAIRHSGAGWPGKLAVVWGVGGVIALLTFAIVRLVLISIAAFGFTLTPLHWTVLVVSIGFMAYAEGYRTFQKTWAPRVIGRAFELRTHWSPLRLLLAPFYCMSFFHATRKRMLTAWITTICIVALIVLMNRLAQPWRGLIDTGVVVGLSWGVAALILQTGKRFTDETLSK